MRALGGILGPVVTTFDPAGGDLSREPFQANLRAHLSSGLAGVVVAGSTGEAALLEDGEREALVEWGREVVPREQWLIAGTGAESTRQCVRRSRAAAARGADAVLVVAPHYYGSAMNRQALGAHYRRVADESPVPVLLYNIPKYAHFALDSDLVAELAMHGNVAGIKDSSGDLSLLESYLEAQSADFAVLTGSGQGLAPALARGARGGILAVALFAAPLVMEVANLWAAGDARGAEAAQARLAPLAREIVGTMGVPGVKAAMDAVGLAGGPVRAPLLPPREVELARIGELLRDAEVAVAA